MTESRADIEQAGRDRADSLNAADNYGFTLVSHDRVQAGITRTAGRLREATTDEQVFSAARDNQRWTNEQTRRAQGK